MKSIPERVVVLGLSFTILLPRYSNLNQEYTSEFRGSLSEEKEVFLKHDKVIEHYGSVLDHSPILSPMEAT
mgnify:CR=1 FL=1